MQIKDENNNLQLSFIVKNIKTKTSFKIYYITKIDFFKKY